MARAALFAASVLLCLALGQSLVCKECLTDMYGIACLTGVSTCTTSLGEPCMVVTISPSHGKVYRIYGCSKTHRSRCGFSKDVIKVECCKNGDMCNVRL